jgi:hypothetical protein
MTGFTDHSARAVIDFIISSYPYVVLYTTVGTDDGTGFVEVTGGSYARFATGSGDWGAILGSAPTIITNVVNFTFPLPTADWGTVYGWGLADAPTAGNIGVSDYIGSSLLIPVSVAQSSPAVITAARSHGYVVDDYVVYTTDNGGTVPTFSQSNFTGVLRVAHASSDTFDVTNIGVQVSTSSTGSGNVKKISPQIIQSGQSPVLFPSGSLTLRVS